MIRNVPRGQHKTAKPQYKSSANNYQRPVPSNNSSNSNSNNIDYVINEEYKRELQSIPSPVLESKSLRQESLYRQASEQQTW